MKNIKRILVPTDFSDASANALQCARWLAEKFSASISVIHTYHLPYQEPFTPSEVLEQVAEQQQKWWTRRLREFVGESSHPEDEFVISRVPIHWEAVLGAAVDEIVRRSNQHTDLIILGASGQHYLSEKIFGSVSSAVARMAHCPVLLIPAKPFFPIFHRILYAGNAFSSNSKMIGEVVDFAKHFVAQVHFIHIRLPEDTSESDPMEQLTSLVQAIAPPLAFEVKEVKDEKSPWEGIYQYAFSHDINLITVVSRQRNFWDSFLHHGLTQKLALEARLPILVLHMEDS